jgi:hypothetical protein
MDKPRSDKYLIHEYVDGVSPRELMDKREYIEKMMVLPAERVATSRE